MALATILILPSQAAAQAAAGSYQDAANEISVGVLPLKSGSDDERWQRIARGFTRDIISDLGQNEWLLVFGEHTTRELVEVEPGEAAAELRADFVVSGRLEGEDDQARLEAAMYDAGGAEVWGRSWEGDADGLLEVQRRFTDEIALELAGHHAGSSPVEPAPAIGRGAATLDSYEKARHADELLETYEPEDMDAAIALLEEVVEQEPDFAVGWARLAHAYLNRPTPDMSAEEVERFAAAEAEAAMRALERGSDRPMPLIMAAQVKWQTEPERAKALFMEAVALAPSDAQILVHVGGTLPTRFPEAGADAEAMVRRAIELNPRHPRGWYYPLGNALFVQGRYAEAAEAYEQGPDFVDLPMLAAASHALAGNQEEAEAALARAMEADPELSIQWVRDVFPWHEAVEDQVADGLRQAGAS